MKKPAEEKDLFEAAYWDRFRSWEGAKKMGHKEGDEQRAMGGAE
jgi:hypothetical protein